MVQRDAGRMLKQMYLNSESVAWRGLREMASEELVRKSVQEVLPTVDLEQATQRSVQSLVEEQLGQKLSSHKKAIRVMLAPMFCSVEAWSVQGTWVHP